MESYPGITPVSKLWNDAPVDIREAATLNASKRKPTYIYWLTKNNNGKHDPLEEEQYLYYSPLFLSKICFLCILLQVYIYIFNMLVAEGLLFVYK